MKNYLKILPAAAGIVMAFLGSTSEVSASENSTNEDAAVFGYCEGNENRVCSTTAQGSTTYGRWKEGPVIIETGN